MPHQDDFEIRPPSPLGLAREAFGVLQLARLLSYAPNLIRQARGKKEPVLVIPGFGTSDSVTLLLRLYLKFLNYTPVGWGLGRNDGKISKQIKLLSQKFFPDGKTRGGPLHLIGWSLGGYLARELARDYPDYVRTVITFGCPVIGGPKYTITARWYQKMGYDLDEIEQTVADRYDTPLTVPVTAIYSKIDRIVAWQACIDMRSPNVEHIEVKAPHTGLGFSPDIFRIIAARLALYSGR